MTIIFVAEKIINIDAKDNPVKHSNINNIIFTVNTVISD